MLYTHSLIFSLHDKRRERTVSECETDGKKRKEMEETTMCEKSAGGN